MNKTGTQQLETHRLILRRYSVEDAEDMFRKFCCFTLLYFFFCQKTTQIYHSVL